jgi:hypothetical protein
VLLFVNTTTSGERSHELDPRHHDEVHGPDDADD